MDQGRVNEKCRRCNLWRVPISGAICQRCSVRHLKSRYVGGGLGSSDPPKPKLCNRGCGSLPIEGMAWCGPCAIAANRRLLGKNPAEDARIEAFIAAIRARMEPHHS